MNNAIPLGMFNCIYYTPNVRVYIKRLRERDRVWGLLKMRAELDPRTGGQNSPHFESKRGEIKM